MDATVKKLRTRPQAEAGRGAGIVRPSREEAEEAVRTLIAYAGDDLTDVPILRRAGLALAPANARPEVKRCAHHVTAVPGGEGAVREIAEILLQAQGHWDGLLKKYEVV